MNDRQRPSSGQDAPDGDHEKSAALPEGAQQAIARKLKEAYGKTLEEPVPDALTELLKQLARSK